MSFRLLSVGVAWALVLAAGVRADPPFDQTHAALDRVLRQHVRDGRVDYAALKASPKPLAEYLDQLAEVTAESFKTWSEPDRLAFLINLYNAATLQLIVDNYPVTSIKRIGSWFGFVGAGSGPWAQKVVRLFGQVTTLDQVEHGIIRKEYRDARIHFALVCAARGCPPIRAEAWVGAKLDGQLTEQGRIFLSETEKNRLDPAARILYLSPIFKWFAADFEAQAGSVEKFILPLWPDAVRLSLSESGYKIVYTTYDWSLNEVTGR